LGLRNPRKKERKKGLVAFDFTGGTSDIVKAKSSGEDSRATGGLFSNLPHPRVNKTKQHTSLPGREAEYGFSGFITTKK